MSDEQYTLDADPLVLAERCRKLEMCCDSLSACLVELTRIVRVACDATDKALCEDKPLQAQTLYELGEDLTRAYDMAHKASSLVGRSY